jgi:DNA mismatch repair ATPase MutS
MTPFRMIETYLHIPDSKGSQSLFEAEMYRSRDYLERLKELGEKDFSFIVLDEIFSSTNYIEGFSGAYAILKKISTFGNTLSMTTTHYSDLEKLEKDTKGRFENYKFEVTYDEMKNITFHYQLVRGTSRQYIALDLLERNGFDKDIIQDAIQMSKQIVITNGKKKRSKVVKKEKESK